MAIKIKASDSSNAAQVNGGRLLIDDPRMDELLDFLISLAEPEEAERLKEIKAKSWLSERDTAILTKATTS